MGYEVVWCGGCGVIFVVCRFCVGIEVEMDEMRGDDLRLID